MRYLNPPSFLVTFGVALSVGFASPGAFAASCDPPGPPPRFGCQWSTTDCTWFCPVCDPLGSPPRAACSWDLNVCNWICPGYTGVDVMVRTVQSPAADATVYVKLSSLCGSTGSLAACSGAFAVHPGMSLAMKCESIAETITANCATAGYGVTFNSCGSAATFTASNVGCSGTEFALGISDDPDVFDQTGAGALPDGELENICAPSPGPARDLRLEKLDGGSTVRLTWTDGANADSYDLFVDQAAGGNFSAVAGTASSGTVGLDLPMPAQGEFFLVAGSNATCGFSPKR